MAIFTFEIEGKDFDSSLRLLKVIELFKQTYLSDVPR